MLFDIQHRVSPFLRPPFHTTLNLLFLLLLASLLNPLISPTPFTPFYTKCACKIWTFSFFSHPPPSIAPSSFFLWLAPNDPLEFVRPLVLASFMTCIYIYLLYRTNSSLLKFERLVPSLNFELLSQICPVGVMSFLSEILLLHKSKML